MMIVRGRKIVLLEYKKYFCQNTRDIKTVNGIHGNIYA